MTALIEHKFEGKNKFQFYSMLLWGRANQVRVSERADCFKFQGILAEGWGDLVKQSIKEFLQWASLKKMIECGKKEGKGVDDALYWRYYTSIAMMFPKYIIDGGKLRRKKLKIYVVHKEIL